MKILNEEERESLYDINKDKFILYGDEYEVVYQENNITKCVLYFGTNKGQHKAVENRFKEDMKNKNIKIKYILYI